MPNFDTPEPISATIDVAVGDIRVTAGDGGATVVEVQPSDASDAEDVKAAELTRVEYANEQLLVKAPKLRSWLSRSGGGSVDVTIELPAGSDVHGTVGLGDFQCDGLLGDCRIKTGVGRIGLRQADALNLRSGAGDINVDRATGRAEVTAGSGDVRLREVENGDLRVNAANGSIAVDVARASVGAKSANGDVRLGEVARGAIALETKIGDLEVGIPHGTAAWLDVHSQFGRVRNDLDVADAPETSADAVEVRARTSIGEIVIRRP
jgi:DUF4097 and DUF4098 domain-containing protein YvlB